MIVVQSAAIASARWVHSALRIIGQSLGGL